MEQKRHSEETALKLDQLTDAIESLLYIRQLVSSQLKADPTVADLAVDRAARAMVICLDVKLEARS